jgi:glutamate 5-kinase
MTSAPLDLQRQRYLNAQNTFTELLSMGVIPIVNENDTVSVSEIKFGDNDTLSAITANMVHADYLFLLTDVDCLWVCRAIKESRCEADTLRFMLHRYTDNPRKNPDAQPVRVVDDVYKIREQGQSIYGTCQVAMANRSVSA